MKNHIIFYVILAIIAIAMSGCKKDKDPELDASPKSLDFTAAGEAKTVNVTSNVNWTVSGKPDWLTLSDATGKGDKQVTVTAAANTVIAPREAQLTISAKGVTSVTIYVNQEAALPEPEPEPTTVSIAAISGVTPPVAGEAPVTEITANEQYFGTVYWYPEVTGTFAGSADYTATISLTQNAGFTFAGVAVNFFTVAGATTVRNDANSSIVYAQFPKTEATEPTKINIAAIAGVTKPVAGATPVEEISETEQYTGTVAWSPGDATFAYSTVYTATITLTPKTGYTLEGVTQNFFTVADATSASNTAGSGVITAVFPKTSAAIIDIAAIVGVTPPVAGATPVEEIPETEQYTGMIFWRLADGITFGGPFDYNTAYAAHIFLYPKDGYTSDGIAENFFTVAGATSVTNREGSSEVIAVFPKTVAKITIAAIAGVTEPATGNTPATEIETEQYTGTVTWSPTVVSAFAASTVYTATITLTAKAGYTLEGVAANFFTVAGATSVNNAAGSGVITATFAQTEAEPEEGSEARPFIITTAADLDNMRNNLSAHYKLNNDIDLIGYLAKWGTSGWLPIGTDLARFSGSFDGDGHKITGMMINRPSMDYVGLFGYMSGATVKNLGVEIAGAGIQGQYIVGGVTGRVSSGGNITNCYVTGKVIGIDAVGGVAGLVGYGSNITGCNTSGAVSGRNNVGGVAGNVSDNEDGGNISNCYATGTVSGNNHVGGVAGWVRLNGNVTNSHATGAVSGSQDYIGGVAGEVRGSVTNCYATGTVSGTLGYVGGVAGYVGGSLTNCYATGAVSGSSIGCDGVGGIAGHVGGDVSNCYAMGDVSGSRQVGGVAGQFNGSLSNCYATGTVNGTNQVGGVVGFIYGGRVANCTALNPNVTATAGSDVGRVVGYRTGGTQANNYASAGMTLWPARAVNNGAGTIDGASVDSGTATNQYNNQTWWSSTSTGPGFKFGANDSNPWKMTTGAGNLPKLYWEP